MNSRPIVWTIVALIVLGTFTASLTVDLIVDYVWYGAVGYREIFTTTLAAKIGIAAAGVLVAFAALLTNILIALRLVGGLGRILPPEAMHTPIGNQLTKRSSTMLAAVASAVLAAMSGVALAANWEEVLLFANAVPFGHVDPIFGRDAGFYVFELPFYQIVQSYLTSTAFLVLMATGAVYFLYFQAQRGATPAVDEIALLLATPKPHRLHLAAIGSLILLLWAVGLYLERYEVMYRGGGLFTGPGYADINGTLPVLMIKAAVAAIVAVGLLVAVRAERWRALVVLGGALAVVWVGGGFYAPALQRFIVSPNELERERPYLEHHIKATNRAYALDRVVERRLAEDEQLTFADIEANRATVNNVRLWDHEPLLDTFGQIQEIRTYYDFVSVDNDRYHIGGELRQTMLSPRELNNAALPSRTWVNERLTFTHGYGLTVGPVNRVNEQGLPVLYVQDLPPRSSVPELAVTRPEIYYGEVPTDYVFVKTLQQEFNYPEGEKNIFSTYEGSGGLELGSLWRRLLMAAHARDFTMLLSNDFTDETRILIYRNIEQRVRKVAPFLTFDRDPYMVIDEGRLFWVLDAYTISDHFPYAERIGNTLNYMRNPVKVVIDAYNGSIDLYLVDPEDPIAAAWNAVFPGALKPVTELRASLREHLRHPVDFFGVQAQMYTTYHMLDVNTFYNKEDQWSVPEVGDQRMEPYYTVMRLPGESEAEFILMLPFTPRLKDNLAAWMVARNDGDLLGQLVVYRFPKQRLIYGPKQMVGRINQDPEVSQQITLWDRAGSNVIRGTLLVIPIEQSLIYIQPLYLRSEDGRIPELKRVIVGYGNDIAMGVDLEDALRRIFSGASGSSSIPATPEVAVSAASGTSATGVDEAAGPAARARRHYQALREAAGQGDWTRFGRELDELGRALRELEP